MPKWLRIVLKLISNECDKHYDCKTCPMLDAKWNKCLLEVTYPAAWELGDEE